MNTLYIVTHLLFSTTYFLCLLHAETGARRLYKTSANSHDKQVACMDGMKQWRPELACLAPMLGMQLPGLSLKDKLLF